ncbi:MAG: GNAT family N-acetyltransferase [Rhodospirillales bacterium]|nr:GNAT family N-acetyltransferase [Rhodospirillales bacterium]
MAAEARPISLCESAMPQIRPLKPDDKDTLYHIALKTGDGGADATPLYADGRLMGHVYAGPYATLCPEMALIAEDEDGVGGYVLGATDTRAFEARLEADWWPRLRRDYPDPGGDPSGWSADQRRAHLIHHPRLAPDEVVRDHPAHLHMNLLPRMQGKGVGGRLLEAWLARARGRSAAAAHVGVGVLNARGMAFWTARGFAEITRGRDAGSAGTIWLGRRIAG